MISTTEITNNTKICKMCEETKELSEFYMNKTAIDGYHNQCKECLKIKSKSSYKNKKSKSKKSKSKIEYRKTKGLISPTIPIKKTTEDGFGGKWTFSYDVIQEPLIKSFIQTHSIYHRNGHRKTLQIKSANQQQMIDLANCMSMNPKAVIHIQREKGKEHLETYVINLYHPTILQVLQ